MTTWFTSDLHFGHQNIITYCNRPVKDLDHMNIWLVERYNSVVQPDDRVFFLGDACMGIRRETLKFIKMMNGTKILIPGNHDDCHPMYKNKLTFDEKCEMYEDAFNMVIDTAYILDGFALCHFPYSSGPTDYAGRDFSEWEIPDNGMPLLCGHVHDEWKRMPSLKGTWMRNVGVDVNDFLPVSFDTIKDEYTLWQGGSLL